MKNMFAGLSKTAQKLIRAIGIYYIAIAAIGFLVTRFVYSFESPLAFLAGLTAGCLLSVAKTVLLEKTMNNYLDMEQEKAASYAQLQYMTRTGLTIVVLGVVVLWPKVFGLFGTIAGILSLQMGAYIVNFFMKPGEDETESKA